MSVLVVLSLALVSLVSPGPSNSAPIKPAPSVKLTKATPSVKLTKATPSVKLTKAALAENPVQVLADPVTGELFVVEQPGRLRALSAAPGDAPAYDVSGSVSGGNEQGLLGAAFSRDGTWLYTNRTNRNGDTEITATPWSHGSADRSHSVLLLKVAQPYSNHNGGNLIVDRTGVLWIGLGDGGSAGSAVAVSGGLFRGGTAPIAAGACAVFGCGSFGGICTATGTTTDWMPLDVSSGTVSGSSSKAATKRLEPPDLGIPIERTGPGSTGRAAAPPASGDEMPGARAVGSIAIDATSAATSATGGPIAVARLARNVAPVTGTAAAMPPAPGRTAPRTACAWSEVLFGCGCMESITGSPDRGHHSNSWANVKTLPMQALAPMPTAPPVKTAGPVLPPGHRRYREWTNNPALAWEITWHAFCCHALHS